MVWGQKVLEAGLSLTAAVDFGEGVWGCGGTRGEKRREAGVSSVTSVLDSLWGPSALNKNVLRAHCFNKSYDLQGPGSKGK